MLCYHKEIFALGLISTLFIVAIITIFESVIREWLGRFIKFCGLK